MNHSNAEEGLQLVLVTPGPTTTLNRSAPVYQPLATMNSPVVFPRPRNSLGPQLFQPPPPMYSFGQQLLQPPPPVYSCVPALFQPPPPPNPNGLVLFQPPPPPNPYGPILLPYGPVRFQPPPPLNLFGPIVVGYPLTPDPYVLNFQPETHPDKRSLFITFSNGLPLTEFEIFNFFNGHYGFVEDVHVHRPSAPGMPPLFGKVVFKRAYIPDLVLGNKESVRLYIDRVPFVCKRFVSHRTTETGESSNAMAYNGESSIAGSDTSDDGGSHHGGDEGEVNSEGGGSFDVLV